MDSRDIWSCTYVPDSCYLVAPDIHVDNVSHDLGSIPYSVFCQTWSFLIFSNVNVCAERAGGASSSARETITTV